MPLKNPTTKSKTGRQALAREKLRKELVSYLTKHPGAHTAANLASALHQDSPIGVSVALTALHKHGEPIKKITGRTTTWEWKGAA